MKVTEHIEKAQGKPLISFEVIPPKKGSGIEDLYKNLDPLIEFQPAFIDVTTSREEYIYIERSEGLIERKISRLRPGTLGICASIQQKYGIDTIPHVLCGGFTKEETEYLLIDCIYLGIDNVMALRGDAMKGEKYFRSTKGGNHYASDLISQMDDLGKGKFLHGETSEYEWDKKFCIGIAGYPEKHLEAPSMQYDIKMLKHKVDLGADYVVTQMFLDNKKYFEFVKLAKESGINVPIIPGIKPIATKKHLWLLPQVFKIDIPEELVNAVLACKNNEEVRQIGIEWAIQQCKELVDFGVPSLHFYTMGKSKNIQKIVSGIF